MLQVAHRGPDYEGRVWKPGWPDSTAVSTRVRTYEWWWPVILEHGMSYLLGWEKWGVKASWCLSSWVWREYGVWSENIWIQVLVLAGSLPWSCSAPIFLSGSGATSLCSQSTFSWYLPLSQSPDFLCTLSFSRMMTTSWPSLLGKEHIALMELMCWKCL